MCGERRELEMVVMKLGRWFVVAGVLLVAVCGQSDAGEELPESLAAGLRHVSVDAHTVVIVPRLAGAVESVQAFGRAAGVGELADVRLERLLRRPLGQCRSAVDCEGPLILTFSATRDEALIYVRVAESDPWPQFRVDSPVEGVRCYAFPDARVAAVTEDRVAVFAREARELREALGRRAGTSGRLTRLVAQRLAGADVLVWVNMRAWAPRVREAFVFFTQTAYMGMAAAPNADMALPMYRQMFDALREFIGEMDELIVCGDVNAGGVTLRSRMTFREGGEVAEYLAGVRKVDGDLFRGLGAGGAFVFASEWKAREGLANLGDIVARALFDNEGIRRRMPPEQLDAAVENTRKIYAKISGMSIALGAAEGEGMFVQGVYLTEEGATILKLLRRGYEEYPDVMKAWGSAPTARLTCSRERIGTADVEVVRFEFEEEDARFRNLIEATYGPDMVMYFRVAPAGCHYVMGPKVVARKLVVDAQRKGAVTLRNDPRVGALLERLSDQPQVVALVDAPKWFEMLNTITRELGMAFPRVEFGGRQCPLMGMAGYLDSDAIRAEAFVPALTVRAVIEETKGSMRPTGRTR